MNTPPRFPIPRTLLCAAISLLAAPGAAHAVTFDTSSGDITQSAAITGEIDLVKTGAGTLTLTAQNTYTGTTTIAAGTLKLADGAPVYVPPSYPYTSSGSYVSYPGKLGTGAISNTGELNFAHSGTLSVANTIGGTGGITQTGTGITTLSGDNTFSGGTRLVAGTLALGSANAAGTGTIAFEGGTLRFSASNTGDLSSRFSATAGQAYKLDTNGNSVTLAANLSGALNLTESILSLNLGSSSGKLVLTGTNDFSGGTTLANGTLELGSAGALGNTGEIRFTKPPAISVSGGVITTSSTAVLRYTAANNTDYSARFAADAQSTIGIDTNGQSVSFATGITGDQVSLIKKGTGSLTLTAANTHTGGTTVSDGALVIANPGALGTGPVVISATNGNNGTSYQYINGTYTPVALNIPATEGHLTLNTAATGVGEVTVKGGVIDGPGSIEATKITLETGTVSASIAGATAVRVNNPNAILGGVISAIGIVSVPIVSVPIGSANTIPATVPTVATLSGNNTYTGGTEVTNGELIVTSASALGTGPVKVSAARIDTTGNDANFPYPANIVENPQGSDTPYSSGSAAGAVIEVVNRDMSFGTLTVNADISGVGTVTLNGGLIRGSGSLSAAAFDLRAGTVSVALTGTGALTKTGNGTLVLSSANTFTGGTTLEAGRLRLAAKGALPGAVTVKGGILEIAADNTLAQANVAAAGRLLVSSGTASVRNGTIAGNVYIAQGATLTLDGAVIDQPYLGHPDNILLTPVGNSTVSTSALVVDGTLNLNAGTHRLGLLAGAGNILVDSTASYSFVASQFTGAISLVNGSASNDRPAATGSTRFYGSVTTESNLTGATNRTLTMRGDGEATVTSDWSGYDIINIRDGITFNLGQGEHHSVGTSILRIDAGATLKGLGSLTGSLVNNGVLSPGNSPGIIAVGDFTNGATGVVNIEIAGTTPGTEFDVIRYSGSATLNGGTLNLSLINGYRPNGPVALRILEDTAPTAGSTSVSGAFAAVNSPSGIYLSLVTDSDGILAKLSPSLGGTGVRLHDGLANADTQAALQPTLFSTLATTLYSGGDAAAARALQALSPIGLTALPALSIEASLADTRTVANRADAHRRLVLDKSASWEAFVGYTGRFADTEGGASAPVFDSSVQGGHTGLEKAVTDNLVVGAMPAYARGKADLSANAGSVTLERAGVSAYTAYIAGSTEALLGVRGSYLDYETRRTHALGSDKGATHGYDYGAFASVSHAVSLGDFAITPEATLGYTRTEISAFDESGTAAALHVKTIGQDSLRARIGSAFDWIPLRSADSSFAIGLAVGAEHELLDHDGEIDAAYAGGTSFNTESALGAESSVDVGPQLTWVFSKSNTIRAGYRYEYGFDDSTAHRLDLSYAKRF